MNGVKAALDICALLYGETHILFGMEETIRALFPGADR